MKFNAIKRLDNGESIKKVTVDLGVGKVTVEDWRHNWKEIQKFVNKSASRGNSLSQNTEEGQL